MTNKRNDVKIIFAERLKDIIQKHSLTQTDFAKKIGVNQSTICKWLQENRKPSLTHLCKIADIFGVEIDYLIGRKPNQQPPEHVVKKP